MSINPHDEEALRRIINYPKSGIGLTTIQKLNIYSNTHNKSIWETITLINDIETNFNQGTKEKLKEFAI